MDRITTAQNQVHQVETDGKPMPEGQVVAFEQRLRRGGDWMLHEASAYFGGGGHLRATLRRLLERLETAGIRYALLGGLALAAHGYPRLTEDIDLLLTPEGLERFHERLLGRGYRLAFEGAKKTFRDTETGVRLEILTTGEYPGDGRPKPVAFPDPGAPGVTVDRGGIRVIVLERLIELKLASGMTAPHRLRDLADVQDLIGRLDLPVGLAERLDASVAVRYRELWQQMQGGERSG